MLKQRIVTAIVLVGLLLGSFLFLPTAGLAVFLGFFVLIGAWEWSLLAGLSKPVYRLLYIIGVSVIGVAVFLVIKHQILAITLLLVFVVCWWLVVLISLMGQGNLFVSSVFKLGSGPVVLIPAWLSPLYLHGLGQEALAILLFLFLIVALADTAAYFAGRKWGRTKLAPSISPGKSVEGMVGGLLVVMVAAAIFGFKILDFQERQLLVFIAISVITALFSVLGDLVESKIKRQAGVKDSGRILPGHGGVLDRIDAFTAAAPFYTLVCILAFLR